jgi:putative FmdB family regulatory protein
MTERIHHATQTEPEAHEGTASTPASPTDAPEPSVQSIERGRLPRYDYECAACQARFDLARPPAEASTPAPCPFCGEAARRVFTSPKLLFKADPRDTQRVWHTHGAYGHAHAPGKGFHGRGGERQR